MAENQQSLPSLEELRAAKAALEKKADSPSLEQFRAAKAAQGSKKTPQIPALEDPTKAKAPFAEAPSPYSESPSSVSPSTSVGVVGQSVAPDGQGAQPTPSAGALKIRELQKQIADKQRALESRKSYSSLQPAVRASGWEGMPPKKEQIDKDIASLSSEIDSLKKQLKIATASMVLSGETPKTFTESSKELQAMQPQASQPLDLLKLGKGPISLESPEAKAAIQKPSAPAKIQTTPFVLGATTGDWQLRSKLADEYQQSQYVKPAFTKEQIDKEIKNGTWNQLKAAAFNEEVTNFKAKQIQDRADALNAVPDTPEGKRIALLQQANNKLDFEIKDIQAKIPQDNPVINQIQSEAKGYRDMLDEAEEQMKPFEQEVKWVNAEGKALQEIAAAEASGASIDYDDFNRRVAEYNQRQATLSQNTSPLVDRYNLIQNKLNSTLSKLGPYQQLIDDFNKKVGEYNRNNDELAKLAAPIYAEQEELMKGSEWVKQNISLIQGMRMMDPRFNELYNIKLEANKRNREAGKGEGTWAEAARALNSKAIGGVNAIRSAFGYDELPDPSRYQENMLVNFGKDFDAFQENISNPIAFAGAKFAANTLALAGRAIPGEFANPLVDYFSDVADYWDAETPEVYNAPMYTRTTPQLESFKEEMKKMYGEEYHGSMTMEQADRMKKLTDEVSESPDSYIQMASPSTLIPKLTSTLTTSLLIATPAGAAAGSARLSSLLGSRGAGALGTFGATYMGTFEDNYKQAIKEFGEGDGFFGSPAEWLANTITTIEASVETMELGPFVPGTKNQIMREAAQLLKSGATKADAVKYIATEFVTQSAKEGMLEEGLTYIGQKLANTAFNALYNSSLDDKMVFLEAAEAVTLGMAAGGINSVTANTYSVLQNSTPYAGSVLYAVNNREKFEKYVNEHIPEADRKSIMSSYEEYVKAAKAIPTNFDNDTRAKILVPIVEKQRLEAAKKELGLKPEESNEVSKAIDERIKNADLVINAATKRGGYGATIEEAMTKSEEEKKATMNKVMGYIDSIENRHNVRVLFSRARGWFIEPKQGATKQQIKTAQKELNVVINKGRKGRIPINPPAMTDEQATRLGELEQKMNGAEEQRVVGKDGKELVIPAVEAQKLTAEEAKEYSELKKIRDLRNEISKGTLSPEVEAAVGQVATIRSELGMMAEGAMSEWTQPDQNRLNELQAKADAGTIEQVEQNELNGLVKKREIAVERGTMGFAGVELNPKTVDVFDRLDTHEEDIKSKVAKTRASAQKKIDRILAANPKIKEVMAKFASMVSQLEQEGKLTRRCP